VHVHIAEDEPLARRTLVRHVRAVPWVSRVSETADGAQTARVIEESRPDILLLDIAMPGLTGLEICRRLDYPAAVIFTTAYDEHAITAFELGAVDYVLKPFGKERVYKALERARHAASTASVVPERLQEVSGPRPLIRVFVREGDAIVPVLVDHIEHAEASDDYVTLHVPPRRFLIPTRLQELEKRLPEDRFLRVHRSHIVSLRAIARIETRPDGRGSVFLRSGERVPASRAGVQRLRKLSL
jgi:two-component system, LytTR family, response regulator